MAAGNTYESIATQTLGSAAATVTFSSISGSYTDLVLIGQIKGTASTFLNLQFNGDTASNYSRVVLAGQGTVAASELRSNRTAINTDYFQTIQTNFNYITRINIMNYSNSTTYKTVLCRPDNAANGTGATVGLWRSTSAITSVTLLADGNSFDIGTTFSLYGIKAA
jgi:hypothetical protein